MDEEIFAFLDIEASSLSGYPIEIGWSLLPARFDDPVEAIESDGFLIRPPNAWLDNPDYFWDPKAEALHGIKPEDLVAGGISVAEACRILEAALGDRIVWCDSRSADRAWLEILFAENTGTLHVPLKMRYWGCLFGRFWTQSSPAILAAEEAGRGLAICHRGRLDAVRLALIFAAAWRAEGRNER